MNSVRKVEFSETFYRQLNSKGKFTTSKVEISCCEPNSKAEIVFDISIPFLYFPRSPLDAFNRSHPVHAAMTNPTNDDNIRIIPQLLGLSPEGRLVLLPMTDPIRESLCAQDVTSLNTSLLADRRSSPVGKSFTR